MSQVARLHTAGPFENDAQKCRRCGITLMVRRAAYFISDDPLGPWPDRSELVQRENGIVLAHHHSGVSIVCSPQPPEAPTENRVC